MKKLLNTALLLFAVLMTSCTAPNAWELVSKDSNVRFALENKQENGSTMLSYSVFYKDGVAMEKSLLGLVMDNCEYGKDAQFVSASAVKDISNAYQLKSGKKMNQVKEILARSGREVRMVENCGMPEEHIYNSVEEIPDDAGYYSLIIAKEKAEKE